MKRLPAYKEHPVKKKTLVLMVAGALCLSGGVRRVTAQDGGVAAYLVMITNQGTQISNQVQSLAKMDDHIRQLTGEFEHLRDAALGQIGAIADPIRDLVAAPTDLLSTARAWHSDFAGAAGDMITAITDLGDGTSFSESWRDVLTAADTVAEADIRAVYQTQPDGGDAAVVAYEKRRERADRQLVLAHARSDAAASLAATAAATQTKIDAVAAENNVSTTALQQAVLAGNLSQGQLLSALAQMEAWDASARAAEEYNVEVIRREAEARRVARRTALEADWAATQAALAASRADRLDSMYGGFKLHPVFGGTP